MVSLDFELYWGVQDVFSKQAYGENIEGARKAIPKILKVFKTYNIQATWAVVGMLNIKDKREFESRKPSVLPNYTDQRLSSYAHATQHAISNEESNLYFAPNIIKMIQDTPGQEIASHTFSHYYCLEPGQSVESFQADFKAFSKVMAAFTEDIQTIIFPRNQVNDQYLSVSGEFGIKAYRGNERGWIYHMKGNDRKNLLKRGLRLLDMYINLFGFQSYPLPEKREALPINIPGSRQLKPVSLKKEWLEKKRLQRILKSMTYAAINKEVYHLWWHPHNFGVHLNQNIDFLKEILSHYEWLKHMYQFESISMKGLTNEIERCSHKSLKSTV